MRPTRAVWIAAVVLFFWWLGGHDLWAPDEPYFAEGAREMVVDGQWVVPHVNGVVTTDKPPLFFWLIALFSLPFGQVTPFTARLPSALAALGTLALTMRLGRRFFDRRTAALAGVILVTSYMFWEKARWSQTDALLCFLIWVALSAFEAYRAGEADGRRAGLLFWLAASLAVLNKGPVGMLLPLGIALLVLAFDRRLGSWRGFAPLSGPLLFLGVTGAWIALTTFWGPPEYSVWGALREHAIDRAIHGLHHRRPPWYYLWVLPITLLPWAGLLPGALVHAWRRRRPSDRFLLAAALFVIVFFSISTEKRELYTLPAFPAIALMTAALVASVLGWGGGAERPSPSLRRWVTVGQAALGALLLAAGVGATVAGGSLDMVPRWMLGVVAALLVAIGGAALVAAWRDRPLASVLAPTAGCAALYLFAVTAIYPAMEWRKSARPFSLRLAETTGEHAAAGHPVVAFALSNLPEAFAFYTNGLYVEETNDPEVLIRHLDRAEKAYAVIAADRIDLPPALAARLCVFERIELARRDVRLVSNQPCPGEPRAVLESDQRTASDG